MSRSTLAALLAGVLAITSAGAAPDAPTGAPVLPLIRPHPQIIQPSGTDFHVGAATRIIIPDGQPAYLRAAADELAAALACAGGPRPIVTPQERPALETGHIVVGLYGELAPLPWFEPAPQGFMRPAPPEGHNIRIVGDYVLVAGNTPRACFLGLQTLIQIARRAQPTDEGLVLPGLYIADWPTHAWRTLQLPFGVYGNAYERGEHRYRHITRADLLARSIRLAAHHKLTGLVVEVGTGMHYDHLPEVFVEGFATNDPHDLRAAVDLARALGLTLVPFQNASAAHDIWLGPYPYAVPNTPLYREALFEAFDDALEVFRPADFHIGMDEDVSRDYDQQPLRTVSEHRQLILDCHDFLVRRGVRVMIWHDSLSLRPDQRDIPRDIIVMPWYYGGWDYTAATTFTDLGFRILCSPWSQWHVENDQLYALYAASLGTDQVLGMAGTIWYPVAADAEHDYRRCLVKAADAFWAPTRADHYPTDPAYPAPDFTGLPLEDRPRPVSISPPELTRLVALLTDPAPEPRAAEAARERLVAQGTTAAAALVEHCLRDASDAPLSPWAEGTLRRIVRAPVDDVAPLVASLRLAAESAGALRPLALELLARLSDAEYLAGQSPADPAVAFALGYTGDPRFAAALGRVAAQAGPAQVAALDALGRLKAHDALLTLAPDWRGFDVAARAAYARAVARLASEAALPLLAELAADAHELVRFRAAVGLGATRSPLAGPHLLRLLADDDPAVFRVALWWCTDTFILPPEAYFPQLIARLTPATPADIVRPILHELLLMRTPGAGQPLADGEQIDRRIDYHALSVWRDPALAAALAGLARHPDPHQVMNAIVLQLKLGQAPPPAETVARLRSFSVEDQRWFCERMREDGAPAAAPLLIGLWDMDDRLVRTLILHYCQRTRTPETFALALRACDEAPADSPLRFDAARALAAHVTALDEQARRVIPLLLDVYEQGPTDVRAALDAAFCRAAGRPEVSGLSFTPAVGAARLAEWRRWWAEQNE